jgi:prepilin-type N-terminal cleavage/methylation domain-containing protein
MKINPFHAGGFTLVEIMIVVAIIGLLSSIAIPNFVKARNTSQANACINNLRQIDSCIQQWALEKGKKDTDSVDITQISGYIRTGKLPICPVGGNYIFGATVGATPSVWCPNETALPLHALFSLLP